MALSSLSDAELWTLILSDDCRAFSALFQRHWLKLYKAANKFLHDDQASEEVVHDLFLNIWNRRQFLVINDFNKYLKAAIRYQVYSYVRAQKAMPIVYTDNLVETGQYEAARADTDIAYRDLESRLREHLRLLPSRCQEVFLMSRMQHYSNFEIAEKLGINKKTVENHLTNALQSIRGNMKDILMVLMVLGLMQVNILKQLNEVNNHNSKKTSVSDNSSHRVQPIRNIHHQL